MKEYLSEEDICMIYITPALNDAGWNIPTQVRRNVFFTKGRIVAKRKIKERGEAKFADYILYYKPSIPIAVIEAKSNHETIGKGMPQALEYAEIQHIPFVYSSNGEGFLEHDRTKNAGAIERVLELSEFPSPTELWERYKRWKKITPEEEKIIKQDYYIAQGKEPRYYQIIAVNKTVEAIAKGQDRILLVMATGTGKTLTAFQIIWRLWKSKAKKRILYLADRNILIDQTKVNDFKPFGSAMTKIRNRKVDKSYEIYLALYQGISGQNEAKNIYKQFSNDFFDLIIVDECHRGSAAEDSAWRDILKYYSSATQIGMTATPKETGDVSNSNYFGEAIYTYSLKQGIEDGFLAPYKVIRIDINKDLEGLTIKPGTRDRKGRPITNKIIGRNDFDRYAISEKRTELVAKRISDYLKQTDRFQKTIVFCYDVDHAERIRSALTNENSDLMKQNRKYVVRITGDDRRGKLELDNFINPESKYPVIATTSKLMTTGVDAQTCKLIVLDMPINSIPQFKQIIGRGTRVNEAFDKRYFTIMDFRDATRHFRDPKFDGEPEEIHEPSRDSSPVPPDEREDEEIIIDPQAERKVGREKYIINDDNVEMNIIEERVEYYGWNAKGGAESLRDFIRGGIKKVYPSLDDFLKHWNAAERKNLVLEELKKQGVILSQLETEVNREIDPFDRILEIAFDQNPQTRNERAASVRKGKFLAKYRGKPRIVLETLLDKYTDGGIENVESLEVLNVPPLTEIGSPMEIIKSFGGKQKYLSTIRELVNKIYSNV
jgi:type I restriction enzyme R subunit